ncbi:MAG TPA: topoisomerase C-terminal repeat-containing protein, partial [Burkholderiaceae bacterium]|nr:topoisomerase C-terminal repeat-containing protein [Burkholderiaceae bacterium]
QNDADGEASEPVDFSGRERLGDCPKCSAGVYEHGLSYVCENSVGPNRSCDFRSGKIILQQEIEPAQMSKLLAEGRSDLLPGFVSQRTRRKFKAFLVRGADGKIGFEFEPRPARPGAEAKAKASGSSSDPLAASGKPAAKKAATKSAAPSKAVANKTAAKTAPAKKLAAKKPAAKKPAARKAAPAT